MCSRTCRFTPDLYVIASLINHLTDDSEQSSDIANIWKQISKSPSNPLHGLSFARIPADGVQIDGSKWDSISFVEKDALHFSASKEIQSG